MVHFVKAFVLVGRRSSSSDADAGLYLRLLFSKLYLQFILFPRAEKS